MSRDECHLAEARRHARNRLRGSLDAHRRGRNISLLISWENAKVTAVTAFHWEKSSVRLNPHTQVRLARLLLDRSYGAPITIEDLSREVALSPYYLIRAFRHVYKQTPHQYLVGQRIARAKELLRNSDLSGNIMVLSQDKPHQQV